MTRAEEIRALRVRHKITQVQLADSLYHVKRDRITDWERGKRNCPDLAWWAMVITWDKVDLWKEGK